MSGRYGGGGGPSGGRNPKVYQIDFTAVASGKRIASSKRRVRWRFGFANLKALAAGEKGTACRGEEHDVTLIWSITSGKRLVLCDGQEVHYSNSRNGIFEFSWTMRGNHVMKIVAHANPPMSPVPGFRQYDFFVDGMSFFAFPKVFRLGLNAGDPRAYANDRPASLAERGRSYSAPKASPIASLEAPHNQDEEEAYLQEAIRQSLEDDRKALEMEKKQQKPRAMSADISTTDLLDFDTPSQPPALPMSTNAPPAGGSAAFFSSTQSLPGGPSSDPFGTAVASTRSDPWLSAYGYSTQPAGAPILALPSSAPVPAAPAANPYGQTAYGAAPAASNPYYGGAPAPAANPYGSSAAAATAYGAPAPAAANPYGAPAPAANPYGAPAPAANPYGAPAPAANPYGAPAPAANPYGVPAPAANPFGAPAPAANPYGAPAAASGGYDQITNSASSTASFDFAAAAAPASASTSSGYNNPFVAAAPAPYGQQLKPPPEQQNWNAPAPAANNTYATPAPVATSQWNAPNPILTQHNTYGSDLSLGGVPNQVTPKPQQTPSSIGFGSPQPDFSGFSPQGSVQQQSAPSNEPAVFSMNTLYSDGVSDQNATSSNTGGGFLGDQAYSKLVNLDSFSLTSKNESERSNPFASTTVGEVKSLADIQKQKAQAPGQKKDVMRAPGAMVVAQNQNGNWGGQYGQQPAMQQQAGYGGYGQPQSGMQQAGYAGQYGQQQPQYGQTQTQQQQPPYGQTQTQQQPQYGQAQTQQQQPQYGQQQQYGQAQTQQQQPQYGQAQAQQQPQYGQAQAQQQPQYGQQQQYGQNTQQQQGYY